MKEVAIVGLEFPEEGPEPPDEVLPADPPEEVVDPPDDAEPPQPPMRAATPIKRQRPVRFLDRGIGHPSKSAAIRPWGRLLYLTTSTVTFWSVARTFFPRIVLRRYFVFARKGPARQGLPSGSTIAVSQSRCLFTETETALVPGYATTWRPGETRFVELALEFRQLVFDKHIQLALQLGELALPD